MRFALDKDVSALPNSSPIRATHCYHPSEVLNQSSFSFITDREGLASLENIDYSLKLPKLTQMISPTARIDLPQK